MRVLALTTLFPNSQRPLLSPYNRQQFAALSRMCDLEVLAAIPWFPGARLFSRWTVSGKQHVVPAIEEIDGMQVKHPRNLYIPRAVALAPVLFAGSLLPTVMCLAFTVPPFSMLTVPLWFSDAMCAPITSLLPS